MQTVDALDIKLGYCYWLRVYIEVIPKQTTQKPTPKKLNKTTKLNKNGDQNSAFI